MADATIKLIAEAVKDSLNAETFSPPFTAERRYVPVFDLKDMKTLHVTVVAHGLTDEPLDRTKNKEEYQIDVAVQKKLDAADAAEIDPLMALVESIRKHLRREILPTTPKAFHVKTENVPIYSQEHLSELRQFTSVLTFTYRVMA